MTRYMPAGRCARPVSVARTRAERKPARAPANDRLPQTGAPRGRETPAPGPRPEAGPDDPGHHIETAFACPWRGGDPVTAILAWLAILPPGADPPAAAGRIRQRLRAKASPPLSRPQERLLDLLDFVAAHRRVGQGANPSAALVFSDNDDQND